jgi:hypothetical protein
LPTRARQHRGGSVTARHLTPALSTARHLRSMHSPCSHRLHVRSGHIEALFRSSSSTVTKLPPHSALLNVCLYHCCAHCRPRRPPLLLMSVSTGAPPSHCVTVHKGIRWPTQPSDQPHRPLHPPDGGCRGQSPPALLQSSNQLHELRPGTTLLLDR